MWPPRSICCPPTRTVHGGRIAPVDGLRAGGSPARAPESRPGVDGVCKHKLMLLANRRLDLTNRPFANNINSPVHT